MRVLGLSFFYHDAAAALVVDGTVVAAAAEERFSRKKHDSAFPQHAVDWVLSSSGVEIGDIDYVVFYEKPFVKFERILMTSLQTWPKSWEVFRESMLTWLSDKLWIKNLIRDRTGTDKSRILFADHHMSHAASSFFCSPFEEAAILTVDGAGEWTTGAMGVGRGTQITLDTETRFPHSLGLLYSAFTAFCGFRVNSGEYKVMGLAPYGEPKYLDLIHKVATITENGTVWCNMDYFAYHHSPTTTLGPKFFDVFGQPRDPKLDDREVAQKYRDIAASIQAFCEQAMIAQADHLHESTGLKHLCMAGGCALNSVANAKILQKTGFDRIYIHPAAGDDGGAVGAAMWATHQLLGLPRADALEHAFLGQEFSSDECEAWLKSESLPYERAADDGALLDRAAQSIVDGEVLGWMRGRFEWGPRALGSRSIIADARRAEMKDIVNAKIKFREAFRPFAPSVLAERASEYFDLPDAPDHHPARYMLYVVPVAEDKREELPAITHVNGSGRLQTVLKETNADYHGLIHRFEQATGTPVILNTSFNLRGEPIVTTPANAYSTFMRSGMDRLYLGNCIVTKSEQPGS